MAFTAGRNAVLKLDNSAGTLVDLSAYITSSDLDRTVALLDVAVYGDTAKKTIPGLADGSIPLQGHYDGGAAAIDAHLAAIFQHANTQTFEIGPAGSASGQVKYTGECRLSNYKVSMPHDGVVDWSATLQLDGAVTKTTWA